MKEAACTGALSAPLALSLTAHSLWNREGEKKKKKKESEYSSSSCTLQPFYSTCFDLLAACRRHSNGSKSQCLCIRGFSPSFAISLTCTHLFARLNHPSSLVVSPSASLYCSCPPVAGRVSSSFSSLVCGSRQDQLPGNVSPRLCIITQQKLY